MNNPQPQTRRRDLRGRQASKKKTARNKTVTKKSVKSTSRESTGTPAKSRKKTARKTTKNSVSKTPAAQPARATTAREKPAAKQPPRCSWVGETDRYRDYHDTEWGVPVHDEHLLFECLTLEGAQAGLSWSTILAKREGYRKASPALTRSA